MSDILLDDEGKEARRVVVSNLAIPAQAITFGVFHGNNLGYIQLQNTGVPTVQHSDPILMKSNLPTGLRNMVVELDVNHSQVATQQAASDIFCSTNRGSVANYETLFLSQNFLKAQSSPFIGNEELPYAVATIRRAAVLEHSEADGDITDFGLSFMHPRNDTGVSDNGVFAWVSLW